MTYPEDLVNWAVSMIEQDIESKNLLILASTPHPKTSDEVTDYFLKSLSDLRYEIPNEEEAGRWYSIDIASRILSGEMSALDGLYQLNELAIFSRYPPELNSWVYLAQGVDISSYRELSESELETVIQREAALLCDRYQEIPSDLTS